MRISIDTNVLVRAAVQDDEVQAPIASKIVTKAELLAVTLPALCEFCWVLRKVYRYAPEKIAGSMRLLLSADNVAADRPAIEAGLALLDAGGDFADGVIAHAGKWLGAETFVSFDQEAVRLLEAQGESARVPR